MDVLVGRTSGVDMDTDRQFRLVEAAFTQLAGRNAGKVEKVRFRAKPCWPRRLE